MRSALSICVWLTFPADAIIILDITCGHGSAIGSFAYSLQYCSYVMLLQDHAWITVTSIAQSCDESRVSWNFKFDFRTLLN